jgi:hypothetical protein
MDMSCMMRVSTAVGRVSQYLVGVLRAWGRARVVAAAVKREGRGDSMSAAATPTRPSQGVRLALLCCCAAAVACTQHCPLQPPTLQPPPLQPPTPLTG